MIWPFYVEQQPIPIKTLLVEGYEPFGDDKVFQWFWLLIQYSDGRRVVEKQTGGNTANQRRHGHEHSGAYSGLGTWRTNSSEAYH